MEKIVLTDEELGSIKSNLLDAKKILDKLWNEIEEKFGYIQRTVSWVEVYSGDHGITCNYYPHSITLDSRKEDINDWEKYIPETNDAGTPLKIIDIEVKDETLVPLELPEPWQSISKVIDLVENALFDIERFTNEAEQIKKKATLLAWMEGQDGMPSAQYFRELYMLDGKLILVSEDQDWEDYVDENGQVYYEEEWHTNVEEISPEEARRLWWDEITEDGEEFFKGGVSDD